MHFANTVQTEKDGTAVRFYTAHVKISTAVIAVSNDTRTKETTRARQTQRGLGRHQKRGDRHRQLRNFLLTTSIQRQPRGGLCTPTPST